MKTQAIQRCINYAPDGTAREAMDELNALEESHAELAENLSRLLALVGEDSDFTDPRNADGYAAVEHSRDALRKAGAI